MKILIADDERLIRDSLKIILLTMKYEIDILMAENGEEAFRIIENESPDIALLDVQMPLADGISIIKWSRENNKSTKYIVISGYSEFNFVQNAINYGASGYLLKPIDSDKLISFIEKLIEEINSEQDNSKIRHKIERLEQINYKSTIEKHFNNLLGSKGKENINEILEYFSEFNLKKVYYAKLLMIYFFHDSAPEIDYSGQFKYYRNLIEEKVSYNNNDSRVVVFDNYLSESEVFVLYFSSSKDTLNEIESEKVMYELNNIKSINSIGSIAVVSDYITEINLSLYKKFKNYSDLRFYVDKDMIRFEDYRNISFENISQEKLDQIMYYMKTCDYKNIKQILKEIFIDKNNKNMNSFNSIRLCYSQIIKVLLAVCLQKKIEKRNIITAEDMSGDVIDNFTSSIEITRYLYTNIADILQDGEIYSGKCSSIIELAVLYVDKNYMLPITIKEIAEKFALHPNYFSTLFKKCTGKSFVEYLNIKKIEHACDMIENTDFSITEIAEMLSFTDTQYFFRLFKKITGQTPMNYRRNHKQ